MLPLLCSDRLSTRKRFSGILDLFLISLKHFLLSDMYNRVSMDKMEICPQFSNFNFTGWDKDSQVLYETVLTISFFPFFE